MNWQFRKDYPIKLANQSTTTEMHIEILPFSPCVLLHQWNRARGDCKPFWLQPITKSTSIFPMSWCLPAQYFLISDFVNIYKREQADEVAWQSSKKKVLFSLTFLPEQDQGQFCSSVTALCDSCYCELNRVELTS